MELELELGLSCGDSWSGAEADGFGYCRAGLVSPSIDDARMRYDVGSGQRRL